MSKIKKRDVVIDADHIAFLVAKSNTYKTGFDAFEGEDEDDCGLAERDEILDLTEMISHFKAIIQDYTTTAEVESIAYKWTIGKVRVIMSDKTNFRYGLYKDYKHNRKNIPVDVRLSALKEWARDYYHFEPNTEADDVCAYYVREKGAIGFTTDKDLFKGVSGIWFNCHYHHRCWIRTTKKEADEFFKMQVLAGDGVDGIPSLPKVGLLTAKKLMDKYGWSWVDMLSMFKDGSKVLGKVERPNFSKKYFVTMVRLVCMSQWTPKKGIKLWKLKV